MRTFIFDFETYYAHKNKKVPQCSVGQLGPMAYVRHPEYKKNGGAYMVSIVETDESFKVLDDGITFVGHPKDAPWEAFHEAHAIAFNLGFELAVWGALVEDGTISPDIQVKRWDCASSMACYFKLPRDLAGAIREGLGEKIEKTVRTEADGVTPEEMMQDAEAWGAMLEYCLDDSIWTAKLCEKYFNDWPVEEQKIAYLTFESALRGFRVDWEQLEDGIHKLQRAMHEAEADIPWVAEGKRPVSPKALAEECRKNGIDPPKSLDKSKPYIGAWLEEHGERFVFVSAMKRWRSTNTLLSKLKVFEERRREDTEYIDYGMKYHAGHTGRWGGDSRTNVQALHKDPVEGVFLRHLIIANEGNDLCVADYSQIEPRVLAWLANDEKFLELLSTGWNPYEAHAKLTMGWDGAMGEFKEARKKDYFIAKQRVLGLGYQCGWKKFQATCANFGMELEASECRNIVNDYRTSNRGIVDLWNLLDRDFKRSVGKDYTIELPSGRVMTYFNVTLRSRRSMAQVHRGSYHIDFYGGKLTENLVQAIARDVWRDGWLNIVDTMGENPVLFHVHDEVIAEIPKDAPSTVITDPMQKTPDWLDGCPIEVDAVRTPHYLKD